MIVEVEQSIIKQASITLGAVSPVIIHAEEAEEFLSGKPWVEEIIEPTSSLISMAASPIDDLRSSARYRSEMVRTMAVRGMKSLLTGNEEHPMPRSPDPFTGKSCPSDDFLILNDW